MEALKGYLHPPRHPGLPYTVITQSVQLQSYLVVRHARVASMARCSVAISQSSWALNEDALSIASYTTNSEETQSAQT